MWIGKIKIKKMPWSIIMGKQDIQWLILGLLTNPYQISLLPHHSITERKPFLCLLPATHTQSSFHIFLPEVMTTYKRHF
jgi:hypothetical protein